MSSPEIFNLENIRSNDIDNFLKTNFNARKSKFLIDHGEWLHKGNNNRFVLILDSKIIGYCGIIPTKVKVLDQIISAFWWVDLIIAKEFRNLGYQTIFDNYIQSRSEIKLGFPNKIASKIHLNHGWIVNEKSKVFKLPLKSSQIPEIVKYGNLFCKGVDTIISKIFLKNVCNKSELVKKYKKPDVFELVKLHQNTNANYFTTLKDCDYFNWRYFDSPFNDDYTFYTYEKDKEVQIALVIRKIKVFNKIKIRIVDLFGATSNTHGLNELFSCLISDAIKMEASQITIMEADKNNQQFLFRIGFILFKKVRFCYNDKTGKNIANKPKIRWSISDSDNDFLD